MMITFPGGFLCEGERVDRRLDRAHPRRHHRPPPQDPLRQEARAELTLIGRACEMSVSIKSEGLRKDIEED